MSDAAPVVAETAPVTDSTPTGEPAAPETTPATPDTPPKEAKPEAPAAPRKLKAKVYGQERELTADFVEGMAKELGIPPEFVLRNLQTSAAAQKRFQEAAELEKQAKSWREKLKANPWEVLKEEGLDPDQAAVERVRQLMEQEAMTPEQRAAAEYQRKAAEAEAKLKAMEDERQTQAQQAETQKVINQLNEAIPAAAEAAGLPRSPAVGRMMIEFMLSQARAGVDVDPAEAAQYAQENVRGWTGEVLKGMNEAQIVDFLGPDVVKRILAHSVAQVRGQAAPAPAPTAAPAPKKGPAYLSEADWRRLYG